MNKVSTNNWKPFTVADIFITEKKGNKVQVPTGNYISYKDLNENGKIARITVSGINNGISGYYDYVGPKPKDYRVYENFISVSFLGTVFYHRGKASLDMKVHCLKPVAIELNENIGLFLVNVIKASLNNIVYGDQLSSSILPKLIVKLPVDNDGNPDWQYMEEFTAKMREKAIMKLDPFLKMPESKLNKKDTKEWHNYKLNKLFTVTRPNARSKNDYDDGNIAFVASGRFNNGVLKYCRPKENEILDKGNCLTISPVDGYAFYQDDDFLGRGGAGSSILILRNDNLNKYNGCFIATVIRTKCNFRYNDMGQTSISKVAEIPLPSLKVGKTFEPDWEYMENYMRKVEKEATNRMTCLSNIN